MAGLAACGTALLLLNVALVACAVRKRRRAKVEKEGKKALEAAAQNGGAVGVCSASSSGASTASTSSTPECGEGTKQKN